MKTALYVAIGLMATAHAADTKTKKYITCKGTDVDLIGLKVYDDNVCKKETTGEGYMASDKVKQIIDEKCHKNDYLGKDKKKKTEYFKGQCDTKKQERTNEKTKKKETIDALEELEVEYFKEKDECEKGKG